MTVTICLLRQASVQCYFITLTLLQNGLRPFTYLHMNGKTVFDGKVIAFAHIISAGQYQQQISLALRCGCKADVFLS